MSGGIQMRDIDRLFSYNQISEFSYIEKQKALDTLAEVITLSLLIQYEGFTNVYHYLTQISAPEWKVETIKLLNSEMKVELLEECLTLDLHRRDLNSIDALSAYIYAKTVLFFAKDYSINILPEYLLHLLPYSLRKRADEIMRKKIYHYKEERKKQLLDELQSTADFPVASDNSILPVLTNIINSLPDNKLKTAISSLAQKDQAILLSYLPKQLVLRIISINPPDLDILEELGIYSDEEITKTVVAINYLCTTNNI